MSSIHKFPSHPTSNSDSVQQAASVILSENFATVNDGDGLLSLNYVGIGIKWSDDHTSTGCGREL